MARGWESKSVEAQIEESSKTTTDGQHTLLSAENVERIRKVGELKLSRSRVTQQLEASTSERYSAMLRQAVAELDRRLAALAE